MSSIKLYGVCMLFPQLFFIASVLFFGNSLSSAERGASAPFISGDTFRAHVDHVFDETTSDFNPKNVNQGDVIFVKTDWEYLETFFTKYHPQIDFQYILLTHNSDHRAPGPFDNYLNDPKLLAWFAQNMEGEFHPKIHPIPIGIANRCWGHGNPRIFSSYLPMGKNTNRPILCYLNFAPSSYPKERPYVWNLFASQPWCTASVSKPLPQYLQDLSQAKFVLSPRGNGLDCHRTWEALLMGAIPIVRSSSLDPLFSDLPVLIIKNWEMITETYLNEQYEIMKHKTYDRQKLFIEYWMNHIRAKTK
jgi:hypothetical protein